MSIDNLFYSVLAIINVYNTFDIIIFLLFDYVFDVIVLKIIDVE